MQSLLPLRPSLNETFFANGPLLGLRRIALVKVKVADEKAPAQLTWCVILRKT